MSDEALRLQKTADELHELEEEHNKSVDRIAELEKALAEAQRQRGIESAESQQAEEAWLKRLQLAVSDRDSLRAQFKFAEQAWQAEREVLKSELAEAQQAREWAERDLKRLSDTRQRVIEGVDKVVAERDTLLGLLRFSEEMLIALRDGIDTEEMHCLPLDVTSSWRYVVDKALERITAALPKEPQI